MAKPDGLDVQSIVRIPAEERDLLLRDPVGYWTRKGSFPIASAHPYFSDREKIRLAIHKDRPNLLDDRAQKFVVRGPMEQPHQPRYLHLDIGISRNAAGVACCYASNYIKTLPVITFDFVGLFVPQPGQPVKVDTVEQVVYDLMDRGYVIGLVTADSYGSSQMIQHFEERGIPTGNLSLDRTTTRLIVKFGELEKQSTGKDYAAPFATLRNAFHDERIVLPYYNPSIYHYHMDDEMVELTEEDFKETNQTWLEKELMSLQLDPISSTVKKPPSGSDDLAQVVAGAAYNCENNETMAFDETPVEAEQRKRAMKFVEDQYYDSLRHANESPMESTEAIERKMKHNRAVDQGKVPEDPFYGDDHGV